MLGVVVRAVVDDDHEVDVRDGAGCARCHSYALRLVLGGNDDGDSLVVFPAPVPVGHSANPSHVCAALQ